MVSVELCSVTGPRLDVRVTSGPEALPPPGVVLVVVSALLVREMPPGPALIVIGAVSAMSVPAESPPRSPASAGTRTRSDSPC